MGTALNLVLIALVSLVALLYTPTKDHLSRLGLFRSVPTSTLFRADDFIIIEDTVHCEDLHYLASANLLFTACEDNSAVRHGWFPGLSNLHEPSIAGQGSIHIIDPKTKQSSRLAFENFQGPFVTHGIDVIPDPSAPKKAVYILAVNHLPNPSYVVGSKEPKAASQVEIFHHVLGRKTIRHIRSVNHALITTPNDIVALSPTSFYVTNDHRHREGLLREIEDNIAACKWSTTVHVSLSSLAPDASASATIAHPGIHNNNGLGRGAAIASGGESNEILITSCIDGRLYLTEKSPDESDNTLILKDTIQLDSVIDNPSYFHDPYASSNDDASGYVLGSLARGIEVAQNHGNPDGKLSVVVWYVRKAAKTGERETRAIFEDDGSRISSASAAVIVPIDPKKEGGKKKGWLFVTGFLSQSMVAAKVDL